MATKLSTNFTLEELTITSIRGIDNSPTPEHIKNLQHTAWQMELVRHILGDLGIHINSAYRSEKVNEAVGGSKISEHCLGNAVDFICPQFGSPLNICRKLLSSGLKFDQLIFEGTWVHISFGERMRNEVLTAHFSIDENGKKVTTYTKGIL